jgi:hypothetical protein
MGRLREVVGGDTEPTSGAISDRRPERVLVADPRRAAR